MKNYYLMFTTIMIIFLISCDNNKENESVGPNPPTVDPNVVLPKSIKVYEGMLHADMSGSITRNLDVEMKNFYDPLANSYYPTFWSLPKNHSGDSIKISGIFKDTLTTFSVTNVNNLLPGKFGVILMAGLESISLNSTSGQFIINEFNDDSLSGTFNINLVADDNPQFIINMIGSFKYAVVNSPTYNTMTNIILNPPSPDSLLLGTGIWAYFTFHTESDVGISVRLVQVDNGNEYASAHTPFNSFANDGEGAVGVWRYNSGIVDTLKLIMYTRDWNYRLAETVVPCQYVYVSP